MSNSLWPCGLKHTRLPCPSLSPRICSDSCPLDWWCHPTFSSSTTHFSLCLQSFRASGIFPVSQFFASAGQSIGASVSSWNSYDNSEMLFYILNKPLQEWMRVLVEIFHFDIGEKCCLQNLSTWVELLAFM